MGRFEPTEYALVKREPTTVRGRRFHLTWVVPSVFSDTCRMLDMSWKGGTRVWWSGGTKIGARDTL